MAPAYHSPSQQKAMDPNDKSFNSTAVFNSTVMVTQSLTSPTPTTLLLLSKLLGTVILVLGSTLKLPSLLPILKVQSTHGIPITPIALETFGFTIGLAFNIRAGNAFTTWGEVPCLLAANLLILAVHWKRRPLSVVVPFLALYAQALRLLMNPSKVSDSMLQTLLGLTVPAFMTGSVVQILENWRVKHIGAISPATLSMGLLCGLGRMFTTLVEVDDPVARVSAILGASLGVVMFWQMLAYRENTKRFLEAGKLK
ncbi:hypothetical protein SpCBS45565_g04610 [Spizellomyces sp. 'palustris']|nr:hypothetical protein SpCBS45565_g04610 [Spizellomyces sp. 'palustris']